MFENPSLPTAVKSGHRVVSCRGFRSDPMLVNRTTFKCEVLDFIQWRYNTKRHWLIIDCAKDTCVRLYLSLFSVRLVCAVYALLSSEFTMPPKPKRSSKKADQVGVYSPWL